MSYPSASGPPTVLTYEEEKAFAKWIIDCSNCYMSPTIALANQKARQIIERRGSQFRGKSKMPSRSWWRSFLGRHPEVKDRRPTPINRARADLKRESVESYFDSLEATIRKHNILPGVSVVY